MGPLASSTNSALEIGGLSKHWTASGKRDENFSTVVWTARSNIPEAESPPGSTAEVVAEVARVPSLPLICICAGLLDSPREGAGSSCGRGAISGGEFAPQRRKFPTPAPMADIVQSRYESSADETLASAELLASLRDSAR
eukprot:scaffold91898_cov69-Phaeocystis_antarctica.AAC.4